jgi:Leucine rich repeat
MPPSHELSLEFESVAPKTSWALQDFATTTTGDDAAAIPTPRIPAMGEVVRIREDASAPAVAGGTTASGEFIPAIPAGAPPPESVSLSNSSLVVVDLSGLPSVTTSLSLAANALRYLDLTPLSSAAGLTALILNGNALASLDLGPLAATPRLERLWLHNNALTELDLSPLAACTSLRSLYLDANKLDTAPLDLTPLAAAGSCLRALRLGRNRLAGELDITPILQCQALSTLDTCASVKLTARTGGAVPAPLPPALRRRAATVHWTSAESESDSDGSSSDGLATEVADLVLPAPGSHHQQHQQQQPALLTSTEPLASFSHGDPVSLPESSNLNELVAHITASPLSHRVHATVVVGFRRSSRFAAEALLHEHGRLTTAVVESSEGHGAVALARAGALDKCAVFLVRPDAASLVAALRSQDADLPIVVVGHSEDEGGPCEGAGATCFLEEPLGQRHALTIRSLAHQRVKAKRPHLVLPGELEGGASSSADVDRSAPSVSVHAISHLSTSVPQVSQGAVSNGKLPVSAASHGAVASTGLLMRSRAPLPLRVVSELSLTPRPRGPRRPPTIDFNRLRERTAGVSSGRSSRVEASAVGMLFSRCGGRAFPPDFSAIATLCGLPVCCSSSLHAAAKAFGLEANGKTAASPALSPVSIMAFGTVSSSPAYGSSPTANEPDAGKSFGADTIDSSDEHDRQADGVSFETFQEFWSEQLRHRDAETRLYNVLKTAYVSEGGVPAAAIHELAAALVMTRSFDMDASDMRALAAAVLSFEIKGVSWHWLRRQEMSRVKLAAALLAAEAGMYNGVAAHLRADRLSDIRTAFAAASGKRVGTSARVLAKDVTWLNKERGLLSKRAVEAIFARHGLEGRGGMDLAHFAPMWLSVSNPSSRSAIEYLFDVLDADADGYLTAVDVAHFYAEKRDVLVQDGFIPTMFEHVWNGLVDSAVSPGRGKRSVSLPDVRQMCTRDVTSLFRSLLFVDDDEMAIVDLRKTSRNGSPTAMSAVSVF